jgi:hypothetical protein
VEEELVGRPLRDLNGAPLGGKRDLDGRPIKTKSGRPVARKRDLIKKQRERIRRFVENPGAPGHETFCVCDECDRVRNPEWWAAEERRRAQQAPAGQ